MKNKTNLILQIIIIIIIFGVGIYFYNDLPEQIPSHWNTAGEIDSYIPKTWGAFLFPFIVLGMSILFRVLPKIDPKKKNYEHFQESWNSIQLYIVLFMAYMYLGMITFTLHHEFDIGKYVVIGIGALFIFMGNLFGKLRQNYFIGIKLPWTLNDEENWNKTHRFGGLCFVLAGIIIILSALALNYTNLYIFIIALIISSILPIIYSYLLFQKQEKNLPK